MQLLFVVPYPLGKAPSQRFRFEQYLDLLKESGYTWHIAPFISEDTWSIIYKPGHTLAKTRGIIAGFGRRLLLLATVAKYDYIFIHREASPIGPPVFEWIVAKVLCKKIIYDFDDAIWVPNTSEANKLIASVKWHHKVDSICRWAYKVSCGNSYLQAHARQFNPKAVVNPTTIDTVNLHNQIKNQAKPSPFVIGWTGTHSTLRYLEQIVPVIAKLEEQYTFEFRVISNQPPQLPLKSLVYHPWHKETEIADLMAFNVGLMPLEDDAWSKGKCAFKALQYMALGIPPLVSPVGMNTEVVINNSNGFVCAVPVEWEARLRQLLEDSTLRTYLGKAARKTVENHYSVTANWRNFRTLFT